MTYNKKQMQPLIDKYAINPTTNKLFNNVLEMFDGQPNFQLWAVKMIFSKIITIEQLTSIKDWAEKNQTMIKFLEKKNIVSYTNKTQIALLFKEFEGIDNINTIKNNIRHFNTEQRKMLNENILTKEFTPIEGYNHPNIKKWANVFRKFERLPYTRKSKFYSNCSRFREASDLLSAITTCIQDSYEWDKEDFLAFMKNNAPDCDVVLDNGQYLIVHVPSFKSSKLLCGNGHTSWCITQQESYFRSYVSDHPNRSQYFFFDFSREEKDAFAHIGFTIENGRSFYCAQTCNNNDMKNGYSQGKETLSIHDVLKKAGCEMSAFLRLNPLSLYSWSLESIMKFVKSSPKNYSIVYEKDGRIILNLLNGEAVKALLSHTLIAVPFHCIDGNNQVFVFIDTNLPYDNDRALLSMFYQKDQYGILELKKMSDSYNADITKSKYLPSIGITSDLYVNRGTIDKRILLHKLIDENDEVSAINLIRKEGKKFDVNFEFNQRIPIISAVNNKMYDLFEEIVNHPSFDSCTQDGFRETILESLIYLYGSEEIESTKESEAALKRMITAILKSDNYDFNAKDFNSCTAINIACEYPNMLWIVKALASKRNVDVNVADDFEHTALGVCIFNKNLEALKVIGQRPDVVVTEKDKKLAKNFKINLDDYLKPNNAIFDSFKFDDEPTKQKAEVTVDELQYAMA